MLKIAVDLAHGFPKDQGSVGIIAEEEVINQVGIYLIKKLKELNHKVILLRPQRDHKNDSMSKWALSKIRVKKCNQCNVDLVLSIHANTGRGSGFDIYTHHGRSFDECEGIINNLKHLGFIFRGIKNGSEIYIIKGTRAKTILIEVCFIDTLCDVNRFNRLGGKVIGEAIALGVNGTNISQININSLDTSLDCWIDRLKDEITVQGYKNLSSIKLKPCEVIQFAPKVSFGARGNITKLIQEKLNINVDGIFGNETRNTLVEFQKNNKIDITGIVDKETWKKFLEI